MRILLVEDDPETVEFIASALGQDGPHRVEIAANGDAGLERALEGNLDLLIVDRMVPGTPGLELVRQLRAAGSSIPVIFLTAMDAIEDRVDGFNAGADDYLVKPFARAELQARIHALARRGPLREEDTTLRLSDLSLDRLTRTVRRGDRLIDLQPREYQLLEALMINAGQTLTRTMLLAWVWRIRFDPGTNIVESHVSRVRTKLGDPPLIHTLRGEGYVIRAE